MISVIIVTMDRPDDLALTLDSVKQQWEPPGEIIVVDDSSDNRTREVCDKYGVKYIKNTHFKSTPGARNAGLEVATGDIICFLDDDVTLSPGYFTAVDCVFRVSPWIKGINGYDDHFWIYKMPKWMNTICKMFYKIHVERHGGRLQPSMAVTIPEYACVLELGVEYLHGNNMCYRRSVFDEFMFRENFVEGTLHEDIEFSHRVYKKYPNSLLSVPFAKLHHRATPTVRMDYTKRLERGQRSEVYMFNEFMPKTPKNILIFMWSRIPDIVLYMFLKVKIGYPIVRRIVHG